eukprot:ANDGO_00682.mRNA.1 hypothetical protein
MDEHDSDALSSYLMASSAMSFLHAPSHSAVLSSRPFATEHTLEPCLEQLMRLLPSIGVAGHAVLTLLSPVSLDRSLTRAEVAEIASSIHKLVTLVQTEMSQRDAFSDQLRRSQCDTEHLSSQLSKARDDIQSLETQNDALHNKIGVLQRQHNAQLDKAKVEKQELTRRVADLQSRYTQIAHELKRKENERDSAAEKLKRLTKMGRKEIGATIEVVDAAVGHHPGSLGGFGARGGASTSLFSTPLAANASRRMWSAAGGDPASTFNNNLIQTLSDANMDLTRENDSLRDSLTKLQKKMNNIIELESQMLGGPDTKAGGANHAKSGIGNNGSNAVSAFNEEEKRVFDSLDELSNSVGSSVPFDMVQSELETSFANAVRILEQKMAQVRDLEAKALESANHEEEVARLRSLLKKYKEIIQNQERVLVLNLDRMKTTPAKHPSPDHVARSSSMGSVFMTPEYRRLPSRAPDFDAPSSVQRRLYADQERILSGQTSSLAVQRDALLDQAQRLDEERRAFEIEKSALEDQMSRLTRVFSRNTFYGSASSPSV